MARVRYMFSHWVWIVLKCTQIAKNEKWICSLSTCGKINDFSAVICCVCFTPRIDCSSSRIESSSLKRSATPASVACPPKKSTNECAENATYMYKYKYECKYLYKYNWKKNTMCLPPTLLPLCNTFEQILWFFFHQESLFVSLYYVLGMFSWIQNLQIYKSTISFMIFFLLKQGRIILLISKKLLNLCSSFKRK